MYVCIIAVAYLHEGEPSLLGDLSIMGGAVGVAAELGA